MYETCGQAAFGQMSEQDIKTRESLTNILPTSGTEIQPKSYLAVHFICTVQGTLLSLLLRLIRYAFGRVARVDLRGRVYKGLGMANRNGRFAESKGD
jgi:hypothetical protein